jgi:hypothetical protein
MLPLLCFKGLETKHKFNPEFIIMISLLLLLNCVIKV